MNPYHTFLGLPESETAPDHYQLLGLARFTSDQKAIRAALLERNTQLKAWDNSNLYREANALLDEVIEAASTLEDPARKSAYDEQLRREAPSTSGGEPRSIDALFLRVAGGIVVLSLLIAIPLFVWGRNEPAPASQVESVADDSAVPESKPVIVDIVEVAPLDSPSKKNDLVIPEPEPLPETSSIPKPPTETTEIPKPVPDWAQGNVRELATLTGHTNFVWGLAFHPDGRRLASASTDKTVKIWDIGTGRVTHTLTAHTAPVWGVAFSHDGQDLASASGDGTVIVWDATIGFKSRIFQGSGSVFDVAYSANGMLASSSYRVQVWDVVTDKELLNLREPRGLTIFGSVVFAPKGDRLAATVSDNNSVKVWDTNGQELLTLTGHTRFVDQVVFSPDGELLATASSDNTVKTWDSSNGQLLLTLKGHTARPRSVAFSVDGKLLVSAHDPIAKDKLAELKFWDATTGEEKFTLRGHEKDINCVTFSQDGKLMASASNDKLIKIWGPGNKLIPDSELIPDPKTPPTPKPIVGGSTNSTTAGANQITDWRSGLGKEVRVLTVDKSENSLVGAAYILGERQILACDNFGHALAWDSKTGAEIPLQATFYNHQEFPAISPDGNLLGAGDYDEVSVWNLSTMKKIRKMYDSSDFGRALSFDSTGTILTAVDHGTIRICEVRNGRTKRAFKSSDDRETAFSADGRWIAYSGVDDKNTKSQPIPTITIREAAGTQVVQVLKLKEQSKKIVFSSDGELLATTGGFVTQIWEVASGRLLFNLTAVGGPLAFSSDKKWFAACSKSTIKVWDAVTGAELTTLVGHSRTIESISFRSDGLQILSAASDGTVRTWEPQAATTKK